MTDRETAPPAGRDPKGRGRKIAFGVLRLAVGVALLIVLGTTGVLDWAALSGLVDGWGFTLAALLLVGTAISLTAWRLCLLLRPRGYALGLGASLRLTLIGTFFNVAMPGSSGGDLVRIYYAAKGNEGRRAEIVTVLLLDRFIGLVALLLYPVILAPLYLSLLADNASLRGVVAMSAGLVAALGVALWLFLLRGTGKAQVARLLERLPGGAVVRRGISTLRSYGEDRRPIWGALGVSLVAHGLGVLGFVMLARATVSPTFEWALFVIVPIGLVVNTVPLTPGGLGVGEAAFAVLFGMAGLQGGPEVLISWRIVTIFVGLAGLVFYLQGRKQFVSARQAAAAAKPPSEPPPGPSSGPGDRPAMPRGAATAP